MFGQTCDGLDVHLAIRGAAGAGDRRPGLCGEHRRLQQRLGDVVQRLPAGEGGSRERSSGAAPEFFLHLSKAEQAERLQARLDDPHKHWKFDLGDLDMRKEWGQFQHAYEDALNHCSPRRAPWHIVPADRKWYRDYVIARTVVDAMEKLKLNWPRPKADLSRVKIT